MLIGMTVIISTR